MIEKMKRSRLRMLPALVAILAISLSGWVYADGPASIIGALRAVFKARIAVDDSTVAAGQVLGFQADGASGKKLVNVDLPGTSFAPTQANKGLFGPVSGPDDIPTMRYQVQADLPDSIKTLTGVGGTGNSYVGLKHNASGPTLEFRTQDDQRDAAVKAGIANVTSWINLGPTASSITLQQAAGAFQINGGLAGAHGILELQGATGDPATASTGTARLVYNTTAGKLRLDLGGGGYEDVATGSGVWTRNTTTLVPTNSGDNVSVPGAGAGSQKFGAGAAAAGVDALAVGPGASAAGLRSVVIGYNATATANATDAIIIGPGAGVTGNTAGWVDECVILSNLGNATTCHEAVCIGWNSYPGQFYTVGVGPNVAMSQQWNVGVGAGVSDGNFARTVTIGGKVVAFKDYQIVIGQNNDYHTLGSSTSLTFNGRQGATGTFAIEATHSNASGVAGWGLDLNSGLSGDAATASGAVRIRTARAGSGTSYTTHTTFNADGSVTGNGSWTTTTAGAGTTLSANNNSTGTGFSAYSVGGSAAVFAADTSSCATMYGNQAAAINVGPVIEFDGRFNTSNASVTPFAHIAALKENSTSTNRAAYLQIKTSDASSGLTSEAARFTSEHHFQIAASSGSTTAGAGEAKLRNNAGTLEVSNNGGSWTAVSTGTSPFTASSTDILTTSASSNVLYLGSAILSGTPVNFTIYGQSGTGANVAGANVTFSSGNSTGNQPSGSTTISTGSPAGTGASGDLTLSTNTSTNGNTGGVVIRSGACGGAGNNSSGSITYQIGSKTGSGTLGHHVFQVNGNNTILEMSSVGASFSVGVAPTTTSLDLGIANTGWKRLYLDYGIDTTAGTSATINKAAGRFRLANGQATFTLTNSYITANSIVVVTQATANANGTFAAVPTSNTLTLTLNGGVAQSDTYYNFVVINTD